MAKKIALKIYFDDQTGEVDKVDYSKRFDDEGSLFKMDVLRDAIITLEGIYQYEKEQFFSDFSDIGEA